MSLLIIFRKQASINKFQQLVLDIINSGIGEEIIICSGFFQEDKTYSVSMENHFKCSICNNNMKITTIGVHNRMWKKRYKRFRDNFKLCGIDIKTLLSKNFHWHAKVLIVKRNDIPIFGIIGSSNMTRPAFGTSTPFNFEADVVLWDKSIQQIDKICQAQTELITNDNSGFIYSDYNMERNGNISPMRKLQEIEVEIFNQELIELE